MGNGKGMKVQPSATKKTIWPLRPHQRPLKRLQVRKGEERTVLPPPKALSVICKP